MAPKGIPGVRTVRLQSINRLKIKRPLTKSENPCLGAMTALLNCWAAAGQNIHGCAAMEEQLRLCADTHPPTKPRPNTINYHLARMYKMMSGQRKKK